MERPEFKAVIDEMLAHWPVVDRWSDDLWEAYYRRVAPEDGASVLYAIDHDFAGREHPPSAVQVVEAVSARSRRRLRQSALRAGVDQW